MFAPAILINTPMKTLCGAILLIASTAFGQTITISEPADTEFCVGETLELRATASGQFADDNLFILQRSSDGFKTWSNLATSATASYSLKLSTALSNESFRVVSTNPFTSSAPTAAKVSVFATPSFYVNLTSGSGRYLVGNTIGLVSTVPLSKYSWVTTSQLPNPQAAGIEITLTRPGVDSAILIGENEHGCATAVKQEFVAFECRPRIPRSALTRDEQNRDEFIWVKAGEEFTSSYGWSDSHPQIIFAETGSTIYFWGNRPLIYAKPGVSVKNGSPHEQYVTVIHGGNVSLPRSAEALICPDLEFDYSQVSNSVEEDLLTAEASLIVGNGSVAVNVPGEFKLSIINVGGQKLFESEFTDRAVVPLSNMSSGNYFAIITRGKVAISKGFQFSR